VGHEDDRDPRLPVELHDKLHDLDAGPGVIRDSGVVGVNILC
jgi:hypothetical protein